MGGVIKSIFVDVISIFFGVGQGVDEGVMKIWAQDVD
jgi:hypothetical protein